MEDRGERRTVTLGSEDDVRYWTDRFNVTRAQLEEAVSAVGDELHAVEAYLRGQGAD